MRLTCSIAALALSAIVLTAGVLTSSFALLTVREGGSVAGTAALFSLAAAGCALTFLCAALVSRRRSVALSRWVLPLVLLGFVALAFSPFAHSSAVLGSSTTASALSLILAAALAATLLLTQMAARLARQSACSCE